MKRIEGELSELREKSEKHLTARTHGPNIVTTQELLNELTHERLMRTEDAIVALTKENEMLKALLARVS
jgi:hypothetical protein